MNDNWVDEWKVDLLWWMGTGDEWLNGYWE